MNGILEKQDTVQKTPNGGKIVTGRILLFKSLRNCKRR